METYVHISSLISKYYKNSSVLRKNYKLALLLDDVLTSFATILTDLGTSSTVIPEDLELGGILDQDVIHYDTWVGSTSSMRSLVFQQEV